MEQSKILATALSIIIIVVALSGCADPAPPTPAPGPTPTPAEEPGVTPTPSQTHTNQERLDAAIQADDTKAIIEAMQLTKTGLIPEPEATQQWEEGSQALAKINQENLDAAIEADDIEGIKGALQFAESAPLPAADAQAQIRRAQEALSALSSTPPVVVSTPELEELTPAMEELDTKIELLGTTFKPYIDGLPPECSQHAWGINNYLLLIKSQLAILRNAVNTLESWLETPTTDANRELKEHGIEMAQDTIPMSLEIIQRNLAELAEYLGEAQEEGCFSATEVSLLTEQIDAVLAPLNDLALMFGL